jgi:hypothetical protein
LRGLLELHNLPTMAKSARSSAKKANKRALKDKVFGPVEDARIERLSAKLQEVIEKRRGEVQMTDAADGRHPCLTSLSTKVEVLTCGG